MRELSRSDALKRASNNAQGSVELLQLDVTDDSSVRRAVDAVLQQEGTVDVLINNAGIGVLGPIEESPDDDIRRVFETNVFGAVRTIRAVLPTMREKGKGTIVNVTSTAGRLASHCMGIYSASKHALEAISESLASEVYPWGIRVRVIEPGFVVTPILQTALESAGSNTQDSPYADAIRRTNLKFAGAQQTGSDPKVVAEAIELAINTGGPRLRFRATPDAELFISGRERISDEDWISISRHESDTDYFADLAAMFSLKSLSESHQ